MTSVNIDEMMKVIRRLKKKIIVVMKQRDTAIEEARIACESRDAVIEEARIACESRDAIEKANMVINNSLIDLETLLPEDEVELDDEEKSDEVEEKPDEDKSDEEKSDEVEEKPDEEKSDEEVEESGDEVEESDDEVEVEEELEVSELEYEGKVYFVDENTNEIYDITNGEIIGKWDAENNKPILSSE